MPDRGDDYFTHFAARHAALLTEQEAGLCHFHLLVDEQGAVLGRVNLVDVTDAAADLGYRVAERATGRGLAAAAVREVRTRAATDYGLEVLTAATTADNPASRRPRPQRLRPGRRHRPGRPAGYAVRGPPRAVDRLFACVISGWASAT
ncbi:hypothetical protein GCM10010446_13790 [Streptomyces enissocaesilis]|uniref:N-acetyltransferase domain-containing protein n=1 Tax=Streptomyces enissocaesilis TaxID=332589 RepID=A0ABP6JF66_9ACTN